MTDIHPTPEPTTGSGARHRAPETWAAAGADYMAGMSAAEVCERYGLARSTFRQRAKDEGWRRVDQADPAPRPPGDADLSDDEAPTRPAELAQTAWREAGRGPRRPAAGRARLDPADAGAAHHGQVAGRRRPCRLGGTARGPGSEGPLRRSRGNLRRRA